MDLYNYSTESYNRAVTRGDTRTSNTRTDRVRVPSSPRAAYVTHVSYQQ